MNQKLNHPSLKKKGFTLVETMVTLTLFSILVPGTLMLSLHISARTNAGMRRNEAASDARYLQQFIIKKINASGLFTRVRNDGNVLLLEMRNDQTGDWEDAALGYVAEKNALAYFPPSPSGINSNYVVVASPVYKIEEQPIFSKTNINDGVRCKLYAGTPPTGEKKTYRTSSSSRIYINFETSPRNTGQFYEQKQ